MFVDQLLLVDVFSQLYYLTEYATKQQGRTYRYKSLKSWKIDNIDLTQQFSLSIFTDFRYQSIKIAWLLSIFMDNDFYRLTTPGQTGKHRRVKFESKEKRLETLFTHRRLFNIYFHKLPFPCILDCTDNKMS